MFVHLSFFLIAISQSRLCLSFAATLQPFSMCELFHAEGLVSPETAGVLANTRYTRSRCPCADSGALRERKKGCNLVGEMWEVFFFPKNHGVGGFHEPLWLRLSYSCLIGGRARAQRLGLMCTKWTFEGFFCRKSGNNDTLDWRFSTSFNNNHAHKSYHT